jgi:hypothetical protein
VWFSSPAAAVPRLRCRWPPRGLRVRLRPIRPSLNDQYGATCLLRLPHGWAPPLSLRRHRHAVGRGAPPSVLGAGSKQSRRKQPATHPQALAGTSFDQAFDGASQRVLEQRTFPPQFCAQSDGHPGGWPESDALIFVSVTMNGTGFTRQFILKATRLGLPSGLLTFIRPMRSDQASLCAAKN